MKLMNIAHSWPLLVAVTFSAWGGMVAGQQPPAPAEFGAVDAQRLQAKANTVLAEVQKQAAGGNVRQDVIDKMQQLAPLTDAGELQAAEALLDEALQDLGVEFKMPESPPAPTSQPADSEDSATAMKDRESPPAVSPTQMRLMKKGQSAVAEFEARAAAGELRRDVAPQLEQFGGLMQANQFEQAEQVIDAALKALGIDPKTLAKVPAKQPQPPAADPQPAAAPAARPRQPEPLTLGPLPEFDPAEFTQIFDGTSLQDWDGDPTYWSVEAGKLVGTVTPETLLEKNSWILWRGGVVQDFELVLDYRVSAQGNSGVGYRLAELADEPFSVRGPQADIHGGDLFTGICYEENGRRLLAGRGQSTWIGGTGRPQPKLLAQLGDPAALQGIVRKEDWNRYRLVVRGGDAQHYLNDTLISEVHDHDVKNRMESGLIGVQVHVGPPMRVEFRDIYLRHFTEPADRDAARGSVVYRPGERLELEHAASFENLVEQTKRLTPPVTTTPISEQAELEWVTRDLAMVRHGIQEVQLFGGSPPATATPSGDSAAFDLVVASSDAVIRVPRAGFRLIGRAPNRDYRVRLQWNADKKYYELVDITPAAAATNRPPSEPRQSFRLRTPVRLRTATEAPLPPWADDPHTFIMLPTLLPRAQQLHVSVNGAWAGFPGQYSILPNHAEIQRKYGWNQAAFAAAGAQAGLIVAGSINGIEGMHPLRHSVPGLDQMACRDANGHLISTGEMVLMCSLNPDWVQWQIDTGKAAIDAGAQWILLDTPMGAGFVSGMLKAGFCEHCMANFNAHLQERYSKLGRAFRFGTHDFERDTIAQRLTAFQQVTPMEQSVHLQDSPDARLFQEFIQCQEETNFASRRHLMETLHRYAKDQGKEVLFCTNAANLGAANPGGHWVRGLQFADLFDLFSYELNNQPSGYLDAPQSRLPRGKWAAFHKLAYAVHQRRNPALIHTRDTQLLREQAEQGRSSRTWMAVQAVEAYAAGGAYIPFHVEFSPGDDLPMQEIWRDAFRHNRFVQEQQDLFVGTWMSGSPVALLFLQNEQGRTIPGVFPSFLGLAQGLVENNYPFDVVFAGDGRYVEDRLTQQQLEPFDALIIPSPIQPTENQQRVIQHFVRAGGVVVCQQPELLGLSPQSVRRSERPQAWWSEDYRFGRGTVRVLAGDLTDTETGDVGTRFYRQYTPELRAAIADLADYLGLRPSLEEQHDGRLAAFTVVQPERRRALVHLVNYDIDYDQDTIRPQYDIRVSIATPDFLRQATSGVLYNCSTGLRVPVAVYHRIGRIECTIPQLEIGAVLEITAPPSS